VGLRSPNGKGRGVMRQQRQGSCSGRLRSWHHISMRFGYVATTVVVAAAVSTVAIPQANMQHAACSAGSRTSAKRSGGPRELDTRHQGKR
jgi:hypothetical protein